MTAPNASRETKVAAYRNSYEHIADELRKLDLLLRLRTQEFRAQKKDEPKAATDQHLYIAHAEVDWLLDEARAQKDNDDDDDDDDSDSVAELRKRLVKLQKQIEDRVETSRQQGIFLSLLQLAHLFSLSPFEAQAVVICLAPELDHKYDRLYAYLQDDITRKKPSVDLMLQLLWETEAERWAARAYFARHAPLLRAHLIQPVDDPQNPSGANDLGRFLQLDPRILNYLLGDHRLDGRLAELARIYEPLPTLDDVLVEPLLKTSLLRFVQQHFSGQATNRRRLILHLHGPYGSGKRDLARALCGQFSSPLLYLDVERLPALEPDLDTFLQLAFREGLLLQSALYLDNLHSWLADEAKAKPFLKKLAQVVAEYGWLTYLAGEKPWSLQGVFAESVFHAVTLGIPDVPVRESAWTRALAGASIPAEPAWAQQLAGQFRLTAGRIGEAVELAVQQSILGGTGQPPALADLYAACRQLSNQKLAELALKVEARHGWSDLVLPAEKLAQLREICSQVKHRYRVLGEWGFEQKLSLGKGVSVLFTGPPGTGKTMSAEVIAHELQLALYKVDLAGVVSKYIGETEKNLGKIFQEAETSNAILFFDEADALFGKRTAVTDAHDRYANIETSYLLQKMEEYEGIVILATNLRENMDEAFLRRLRFIVEFPFPDEANRLKIWQTHFPQDAPLETDIDFPYLARQFKIAGGNIRNIVLNSAFLAAENGGVISMKHILQGVRREYEKVGKLWNEKSPYPAKSRVS